MNAHPEWYFVRHEDLSENPTSEFRNVSREINLDYTRSLQIEIFKFSRLRPSAELGDLHSIERDSKANICSWKNRITGEEIDRVRAGTSDI